MLYAGLVFVVLGELFRFAWGLTEESWLVILLSGGGALMLIFVLIDSVITMIRRRVA
jgi:hypothetical protein